MYASCVALLKTIRAYVFFANIYIPLAGIPTNEQSYTVFWPTLVKQCNFRHACCCDLSQGSAELPQFNIAELPQLSMQDV
jgi:hypothetical protein